jgi:hypothetical protein
MPEFKRDAAETEVLIGSGVLENSIEFATKPVLDNLESSVLKALGLITEQVTNLTNEEKLHIEARMYESAALISIGRVLQIADSLEDAGRQFALRHSLHGHVSTLMKPSTEASGEPKAD